MPEPDSHPWPLLPCLQLMPSSSIDPPCPASLVLSASSSSLRRSSLRSALLPPLSLKPPIHSLVLVPSSLKPPFPLSSLKPPFRSLVSASLKPPFRSAAAFVAQASVSLCRRLLRRSPPFRSGYLPACLPIRSQARYQVPTRSVDLIITELCSWPFALRLGPSPTFVQFFAFALQLGSPPTFVQFFALRSWTCFLFLRRRLFSTTASIILSDSTRLKTQKLLHVSFKLYTCGVPRSIRGQPCISPFC
jgi:hypothetical protein